MKRHRFGARTAARLLALLGCAMVLSGCASSYRKDMAATMDASRAGSLEVALGNLEAQNTSTDKSLLYFLEKGELLRMKGAIPESRDHWLQADGKVREWEEAVKTDPAKLLGDIGSFVVNDTTRRYDGRDYEKVLLSMRLALDHLALGDWDNARVEIKKMHEREAIIAEFRSKDLEDAKSAAEGKGLKTTSFKELNGYPVETLTAPEVVALKNSYESAVANYLAGFIYESQGELSLAAAGYRKAIEMRGGDPFLEDALQTLEQRNGASRAADARVDTLFIVESGHAPAISSRTLPIPLPIPSSGGIQVVMTPLSWPVVEPVDMVADLPTGLRIDDEARPLSLVTNVDHMARRALADEMPGIIARSSIRAIAKGAAQKVVQDNTRGLGLAGALISIAASVTAVASEGADERLWRTQPGFYSISRASLPAGSHRVVVDTSSGPFAHDVQVSGKHAVVVLRHTGNNLYVTQPPYTETAPAVASAPAAPPVEAVVAPAAEAAPAKVNAAKKASASPKTKAVPKTKAPAKNQQTAAR